MIFIVNMHGLFLQKIKNVVQLAKLLKKILDESNCKPNKILVDKSSQFYNRSMKSWLQDNYIEICLTHNGEKSVVV